MKTNTLQCVPSILLTRFLDEQLGDTEESQVSEHLSACVRCQGRLERMVGQKQEWRELQDNLLDYTSGSETEFDEYGFESPAKSDLAQIANLLGPTDDPTKMGRIGAYEICGVIGRGSAGIVFKALDPRLNRFVAIKILAPSYAHNDCSRQRFEREGRSIASVNDASVVPIHGVGEFQGIPYIVMQYMPAGSLHQRIDSGGPLSTCQVVRLGMQIAGGLAAAHRQGIIHRDVKPANVLLEDGFERAMVTDFGLARVADEATMTRTGAISGTPQYMSPEQAKGELVDARSDLFSLGSVLYAACTGHSPFRSETLFGVIKRVCDSEPRPIRETHPEIEPWLAAFIEKLLSKLPEHRFQTSEEVSEILAQELAHLQSPAVVSVPTREWWTCDRTGLFATSASKWIAAGAVAVAMVLAGLISIALDKDVDPPAANMALSQTTEGLERPTTMMAYLETTEPPTSSAGEKKRKLKALLEAGNILLLDGSHKEAGEIFKVVLEQEPTNDQAASYYGAALHFQGNLTDAVAWHKRAAKSPKFAGMANYNLACASALMGDPEEAFMYLDVAIKNGFLNLEKFETDPDLDSLRDDQRFRVTLRLVKQCLSRESVEASVEDVSSVEYCNVAGLSSLAAAAGPEAACDTAGSIVGVEGFKRAAGATLDEEAKATEQVNERCKSSTEADKNESAEKAPPIATLIVEFYSQV